MEIFQKIKVINKSIEFLTIHINIILLDLENNFE